MLIKENNIGLYSPKGYIANSYNIARHKLKILSRYFTTLTAAGGMYYSLASPVTLSGDFEIEFDVMKESIGSRQAVLGKSLTATSRLFVGVDTNGSIRFNAPGYGTLFNTVFTISSNQLTRIKISRSSTLLTIDNISTGVSETATVTADVYIVDAIGSHLGSDFFSGIISNLTIKQSGTLTHSWALDSDGTTGTEIDTVGGNNSTRVNMTAADTELFTKDGADWVGEEIVVNGGFDSDINWTKDEGWIIADGVATCSTITNKQLYQSAAMPIGKYRTKFSIESHTTGKIRINTTSEDGTARSSVGVYSEDLNLTSSDTLIRLEPSYSAGFAGSIDNLSIKRLIEVA